MVGTEGEASLVLIGPGGMAAPQKKAAMHGAVKMDGRGAGHGVVPQFAGPEASKSARLGKISRDGVKPGQMTKFLR